MSRSLRIAHCGPLRGTRMSPSCSAGAARAGVADEALQLREAGRAGRRRRSTKPAAWHARTRIAELLGRLRPAQDDGRPPLGHCPGRVTLATICWYPSGGDTSHMTMVGTLWLERLSEADRGRDGYDLVPRAVEGGADEGARRLVLVQHHDSPARAHQSPAPLLRGFGRYIRAPISSYGLRQAFQRNARPRRLRCTAPHRAAPRGQ